MAYVGRGTIGHVYTSVSPSSSGKFSPIGTDSGLTQYGIVIAQGLSGFTASNALGNGQLLIGSNATNPVPANLTAGTGISITNGAGSITIGVNGSVVGQTITGDSGGALSPTAGNWNIVSTSTNGIDTSGSGSTLTVGMATPYADGDFEFRSAVSGQTRTLSVTNTVDAASSQATVKTSVAGTSSGDVWQQLSIGSTTSMAIGLDNSDSDKLKITYAASGSIDPSSGSTWFSMVPTTGAATFQASSPANNAGITSQPSGGSVAGGYRALYGSNTSNNSSANITIGLGNDTANAEGGIMVGSTTNSGVNPAPSTPNKLLMFSNVLLDGIIYSTQKDTATHAWYTAQSSTALLVGGISAAGYWTKPKQPCFFGYLATGVTNVTGDSTAYTVAFDSESFDQSGSLSGSTFTAPVAGKYFLQAAVTLNNMTSAANPYDLEIRVNGSGVLKTTKTHSTTATNDSINASGIVSLAASDTVTVVVIGYNTTKSLGVAGSASNWGTYFSGYLVA